MPTRRTPLRRTARGSVTAYVVDRYRELKEIESASFDKPFDRDRRQRMDRLAYEINKALGLGPWKFRDDEWNAKYAELDATLPKALAKTIKRQEAIKERRELESEAAYALDDSQPHGSNWDREKAIAHFTEKHGMTPREVLDVSNGLPVIDVVDTAE